MKAVHMKRFTFEVQAFATFKITAPNEEAARASLHGMVVDVDMEWIEPNALMGGAGNINVTLTQVAAEDGEPELTDTEDLEDE